MSFIHSADIWNNFETFFIQLDMRRVSNKDKYMSGINYNDMMYIYNYALKKTAEEKIVNTVFNFKYFHTFHL